MSNDIQEQRGSSLVIAPSSAGASGGVYTKSARGSLESGGAFDLQSLADISSGHVLRPVNGSLKSEPVNLSQDEVWAQYNAVLDKVNQAQDNIRISDEKASSKFAINKYIAKSKSLDKADDAAEEKLEGVVKKLIVTGAGAGVSALGGSLQMKKANEAAAIGKASATEKKAAVESRKDADDFDAEAFKLRAKAQEKNDEADALEQDPMALPGAIRNHRDQAAQFENEAVEKKNLAAGARINADRREESAIAMGREESLMHSKTGVFQPAIVANNQMFDSAGTMSQAVSDRESSLDQNESGRWDNIYQFFESVAGKSEAGARQAKEQQQSVIEVKSRLAEEVLKNAINKA